jgi:hypothetical protein
VDGDVLVSDKFLGSLVSVIWGGLMVIAGSIVVVKRWAELHAQIANTRTHVPIELSFDIFMLLRLANAWS